MKTIRTDRTNRFKKEHKTICKISLGNSFSIYSEETLEKVTQLDIKENDFVVLYNIAFGGKFVGKITQKNPFLNLNENKIRNIKPNVQKGIICRKATLMDRFLDKMGWL